MSVWTSPNTRSGVGQKKHKWPRISDQRAGWGAREITKICDAWQSCVEHKLLLLIDYATLHYEDWGLQKGDVLSRISIYGDNIGILALLQCANAVGPAQQIGSIHGGGLNCLDGSHSHLYIDSELVCIEAMRKD